MTKTQRRRSKRQSKKRVRDSEATATTTEETRKRPVTFSPRSPQIHDADSEEKGADEGEQGATTQETPTLQNDPNETTAATPTSTINPKREREENTQSDDAFTEFNPLDQDEKIEMDSEVNDTFSENKATSSGIGGVHVKAIVGSNWFEGQFKIKVEHEGGPSTYDSSVPDGSKHYFSIAAR